MKSRTLKISAFVLFVCALFVTGIPIPTANAQDGWYSDEYYSSYEYDSYYEYEEYDTCDCDGGGGRWSSLLRALPSMLYVNSCNTTQLGVQRVSY